MAKNSVRDYSATNADNTDIQSIDISEGCSPAGINNAVREVMVDLKNVSTGAVALETPSADQLNVDNLRLDGNTISSTDTNGDITIDPDGTGDTIVASGNVGIGTTSPTSQLSFGANIGRDLAVYEGVAGANKYGIGMSGDGSGGDPFRTKIYANGNENISITSAGNVGVGTTTPDFKLEIVGATNDGLHIKDAESATVFGGFFTQASNMALVARSNHALTFGTNDTENMRITTGGTALIGSTSARATGSKLELTNPANTATVLYMFKTGQVEATMGFKASTDSNFYIGSGSTNVGTNGVYLTNTGNSWNSISDETQKTIVENIENASEKVSTLRTVMGYYNHDENETRRPFLIAQDVQAVLPEAVSVQDAETGVLGMSYTDVIPLLTAAIKEQRETINSLEARITALEAV